MAARRIAEFLYRQASKKWVEEGWKICIDLREGDDRVAEIDHEEQIITLKPHGKKDLPIERSLWHEFLHMLFDDEDTEAEILALESATWSVLPAKLKRYLKKMVADATGSNP